MRSSNSRRLGDILSRVAPAVVSTPAYDSTELKSLYNHHIIGSKPPCVQPPTLHSQSAIVSRAHSVSSLSLTIMTARHLCSPFENGASTTSFNSGNSHSILFHVNL